MESTVTFISNLSRCEYLPDRLWQLRYQISREIRAEDYMDRLRGGWRRSGWVVYRPECPSCRMCQSLRVPTASFRPNTSQRRAWTKNEGNVTIRIRRPSSSPEKLELFAKFHGHGHETKGWPEANQPDLDLFCSNPFGTEEWAYHLGDRLVGVGYVDALPEGLSAIYFFHDPAEGHRSLGTFNILAIIASARERGLPHVYLGYYVEGCRSLEYKARFRPNEVLGVEGAWEPFV
jgi:arginyl-tRNA--protein-N-Asp/Glu arginylyltransferase